MRRLVWASMPFDRCPHEDNLLPSFFKSCAWMILKRLWQCAGWSEPSLGAHTRRYVFWRCGVYSFTGWSWDRLLAYVLNTHSHEARRQAMIKKYERFLHRWTPGYIWAQLQSRQRPAKIQISLHICAVWSESSLGAFLIDKDTKCLHADNEDSDQTTWMRWLIWVLVGAHVRRYVVFTLLLICRT